MKNHVGLRCISNNNPTREQPVSNATHVAHQSINGHDGVGRNGAQWRTFPPVLKPTTKNAETATDGIVPQHTTLTLNDKYAPPPLDNTSTSLTLDPLTEIRKEQMFIEEKLRKTVFHIMTATMLYCIILIIPPLVMAGTLFRTGHDIPGYFMGTAVVFSLLFGIGLQLYLASRVRH